MTIIGPSPSKDTLVLFTGRDFNWIFSYKDEDGKTPLDFPAGSLYFEFLQSTDSGVTPTTSWTFTIAADVATLAIDSAVADLIEDGTSWQLVFLPDGDEAGGDPVSYGTVRRKPNA